jgi:hypothetical protein
VAVERITVAAVEAAVVQFDAEDRAIVGQVVMNFSHVAALVASLTPGEWESVAAYLYALLERSPLKDGRAYLPHRVVLGSIASDLRGYAVAAGEPVGLEVDLRAVTSKDEERRIRERIADRDAAFDRHIDDVIAQSANQRTYARGKADAMRS